MGFMNPAITCNLQTISWAVNEQMGNFVLKSKTSSPEYLIQSKTLNILHKMHVTYFTILFS